MAIWAEEAAPQNKAHAGRTPHEDLIMLSQSKELSEAKRGLEQILPYLLSSERAWPS